MINFMRRRHERRNSLNLINFTVAEENGRPARSGMGRTRNISGSGLLMETHIPLEPGEKLEMTLGIGDNTVEIRGYVVHMEPAESDWFWSGIEFTDIDREGRKALVDYLEAFARVY
jgi:hypothetical protein